MRWAGLNYLTKKAAAIPLRYCIDGYHPAINMASPRARRAQKYRRIDECGCRFVSSAAIVGGAGGGCQIHGVILKNQCD